MTERWLGLSDAAAALDETVADLERKVLQRKLPARQTNGSWQVLVEREAERPDSAFLSAMDEMTHDARDANDAGDTLSETGLLGMTMQATSVAATNTHEATRPAAPGAVASNATSSPQPDSSAPSTASTGTASMASDPSTAFAQRASSSPPLKPPPPPRISDIPRPWMGLVAFFVLVLIAWLWLTVGSASVTGRDEALKNAIAAHSTDSDAQSGAPDEVPSWIIEYEEPAANETSDLVSDPASTYESSILTSISTQEPERLEASNANTVDVITVTQGAGIESSTDIQVRVEPAPFDESSFLDELTRGKAAPPRFGEWRDDALALGAAPRIKTHAVPEIFTSDKDRLEQTDEMQAEPTTRAATLKVNAEPAVDQPNRRAGQTDHTEADSLSRRDDSKAASREPIQPIAPTAAHWPSSRTMASVSSTRRAADTQWTEHLGPPAQFVLMMSLMPGDSDDDENDDENNNQLNSDPTAITTPRVKPHQSAQPDMARVRRPVLATNDKANAATAEQAEIISIAGPPAVAAARVQQQARVATRPRIIAAPQSAMHAPYYCPDCFN